MSGSLGKSESNSDAMSQSETSAQNDSSASFNQDVWGGQSGALQGLYGTLSDQFAKYDPWITPPVGQSQPAANTANTAALDPWKYQMSGGAFSGLGLQNLFRDYTGQQGSRTPTGPSFQYQGQTVQGEKPTSVQGWEDLQRDADYERNKTPDQRRWDEERDWQRAMQLQGLMEQQTAAQQWGISQTPQMQQNAMGAQQAFNAPWDIMSQYANILGRPTVLNSGEESSSSTYDQSTTGASESDSKGLEMAGGLF